MRLRPLAFALIACLALADLAGAAWLWVLWQERAAQPPAWAAASATPERSSAQRAPQPGPVGTGARASVSTCLGAATTGQGSFGCR